MRKQIQARSVNLIIVAATISQALADDHSVYVAPGPRTIIAPVRTGNDQVPLSGSTRKLGDLIGSSLKLGNSPAVDVVVTTKCGHYQFALITYADGTVKSLNLSNAPATKSDLEQAKTAIPVLKIVDVAGC